MAIKIMDGFTEIKLDDPNEGRRDFFDMIMTRMQEIEDKGGADGFCAFIIGRKIEGVGGYFTGEDYIYRLVLPEGTATYDESMKLLKFADDKKFGIFVHEASHFLHLVVDKGEFISPSFEKLEPMRRAATNGHLRSNTKYMEFEAGYRSLYYNKIYEMYPEDDKTIWDLNMCNMLNYVSFKGHEEFIEELRKIKDPDEQEKMIAAKEEEIKEMTKGITKWSQLDKFEIG